MSFRKKSGVETRFVIALLLGAGLFAAGCSCMCPKYIGEGGPEPVNVLVVWDDSFRQIAVFPNSVRICEQKQKVQWVLMGAPAGTRMDITPVGESPFVSPPTTIPRVLPAAVANPASREPTEKGAPERGFFAVESGVAKLGTAGKRYKYSVTLHFPGGGPVQLDPWVEVDR